MTQAKRWILPVLIVALIAAIATVAVTTTPPAEAAETFVADDETVFGHITDLHYFPLAYCYNGETFSQDYYDALITDTKLFMESSLINAQALRDIADAELDYLLVAGDITLNAELQAHIEVSNLLRRLQNDVRKTNPDFQIFVTMGNHDMYNARAFRHDSGFEVTARSINRYEFSKIYSSLGYPDLTDDQIADLYDYIDNTPDSFGHRAEIKASPLYEGRFINSTTAEGVEIEYQNPRVTDYADRADFDNGEISYFASTKDDYGVISIDAQISDAEIGHYVGGRIFESTFDWMSGLETSGKLDGLTLVGLTHQNIVPHFPLENTLLKDFTVYEWVRSADFLADLGMRYAFTGHMHSTDVASHVSFNGNPITDFETASSTGYRAAVRYVKIERGSVGSDYAETVSTRLEAVSPTDFSILFEQNYMPDNYLAVCGLEEFVNDDLICTDVSEYSVKRLFLNIADNVKYAYLTPDFIGSLGSLVQDLLPDNLLGIDLSGIKPGLGQIVNNLIDHIENVALKDYVYRGDNPEYTTDKRGAKLCGYLEEIVDKALTLPVTEDGLTLFDFGMWGYLTHVGGLDVPSELLDDQKKEAIENFNNGTAVRALLDLLLDAEKGLLPLVDSLLTTPIDLTAGVHANVKNALGKLLSLIGGGDLDLSHLTLATDLSGVLDFVLPMLGLEIDLGDNLKEFVDHTLASYLTDSFYSGLGSIAGEIMYQFYVDDDGYDGDFTARFVRIDTEGAVATYQSGKVENPATVENGKLPSMLTVVFGEDPATEKNFTWFTDPRVKGSDIQYVEGTEFDERNARTASGEYQLYATSTASIDLGIFATLMDVSIARHTVSLSGLKSGTVYSYRVGCADKGYWSDVYTMKTAPAKGGAFDALLITDIQGFATETYRKADQVLSGIDEVFPGGYDFVINAGDSVDNSRNLLHYRYMLDILRDTWGNTSQVLATGNHEKYAYEYDPEQLELAITAGMSTEAYNYSVWHYNYDLPPQSTETGAYYSFDYSDVHFVVLNTNDLRTVTQKGEKIYQLGKGQTAWLEQDLAASTARYQVVVMHKGLYTAGAHAYDPDVVGLRAQLTPLFAKYGVDLVLQGHDHTYSEILVDKDGNFVPTKQAGEYVLGDGNTLYVTLGTLGDKFYDFVVPEDEIPFHYGKELHDAALSNPIFARLSYDGNSLTYKSYQYDLQTDTIVPLPYADGINYRALGIVIGLTIIVVVALVVVLTAVARYKKGKKGSRVQ